MVEFVAYVVFCAPDNFPTEDHVDLEKAFAAIEESLGTVLASEQSLTQCSRLLDEAHDRTQPV